MSIENPNEITRVIVIKDRWGVVMYNYCAMHSYPDMVVAGKYRRDVFQANIVSRETRRGQCAQSSAEVGARHFVFGRV